LNLQQARQARSSYERWGAISATAISIALFYPAASWNWRGTRATFLRKTNPSSLRKMNPSSATTLPSEVDDQEQRFSLAFQILETGIAERAFPAASVAVTQKGYLVALKAFGRFTYEAESPIVTTDTIFDLASISKVVATTTMAMILYQRGLLDLDAPVLGVVPEFASEDGRRSEVSFRMLLAHSSGLPAHEKLYLHAANKEALLQAAVQVPLKTNPGTSAEYSDIGFIVLGLALERIAKEPLDAFCQREIFGPLGMKRTTFCPPSAWKASIPPTADDRTFRKRIIQGEVYDENASLMEGVAPHAGVFSTAYDVASFALAMLNGGTPILRPDTVTLFTRRETSPPEASRALGWDTPSNPSQSGKYLSARSFGHLGYTGTSLWIDPERQVSMTLLTNRTWPDSTNQAIKQIRPRFHDAVIDAMEKIA
jgi:CubicO group peptidase (beta-lactamase class C family)